MTFKTGFKPQGKTGFGAIWQMPAQTSVAMALMAGLGLGASAASANGILGGGLLGGGSVAGVSASVGGGSLASVGANVGGLQVGASVLDGTSVARGCVGTCGTTASTTPSGGIGVTVGGTTPTTGGVTVGVTVGGTTTPGTTTTPPTSPPTTPTTVSSTGTPNPIARKVIPASALHCAGAGNSAVYNGYPVVDRNGVLAGWVHDTRLSPDLKIVQVQFEALDKRCVNLSGGGIKAAGYQMRVNIDKTAMQ